MEGSRQFQPGLEGKIEAPAAEFSWEVCHTTLQFFHVIDSQFDQLAWKERVPGYAKRKPAYRSLTIQNPEIPSMKGGSKFLESAAHVLLQRYIQWIGDMPEQENLVRKVDALLLVISTDKRLAEVEAIRAWVHRSISLGGPTYQLLVEQGAGRRGEEHSFTVQRSGRAEFSGSAEARKIQTCSGDRALLSSDWHHVVALLERNLTDLKVSSLEAAWD